MKKSVNFVVTDDLSVILVNSTAMINNNIDITMVNFNQDHLESMVITVMLTLCIHTGIDFQMNNICCKRHLYVCVYSSIPH